LRVLELRARKLVARECTNRSSLPPANSLCYDRVDVDKGGNLRGRVIRYAPGVLVNHEHRDCPHPAEKIH